ncbi:MAG: crotonase/enoyl-CoA hydratase family protein [Gammaproteobacteria bacterium]
MSDYQQIRYTVTDGIAEVRLFRPARMNAFTLDMKNELVDVIGRIDRDDAVRVAIFTGEGKAFCAGMELEAGGDIFGYDIPQGDTLNLHEIRDSGGEVVLAVYNCRKPMIAAINGAAVGVGVTMTLPFDFRLCSHKARFGFVFTQRGIVPESCSMWFLPRVVGMQTALEWTLTGDLFDAQEALRAGFVRSVHAPEDLLAAAHDLAKRIRDRTSPVSVAIARQMMWRSAALDHPMQAHVIDSKLMYQTYQMPDGKDGFAAFLEKRAPVFTAKVSADLPSGYPWWIEPELK